MRRLPSVFITCTMIALALLAFRPDAAQAGGAVWNFNKEIFQPGERATGRVTFGSGSNEGKVSDGPFQGYLVPGTGGIDPPKIPANAIPVGEIAIRSNGGASQWIASISFTVPNATSGRYALEMCNQPCRVSAVEEISFGSVIIAASAREAQLIQQNEGLERRLSRTQALVRRQTRDLERAEATAKDAVGPEPARAPGAQSLETEPQEGSQAAFESHLPWFGLGVLAGLVPSVLVRRRRQHHRTSRSGRAPVAGGNGSEAEAFTGLRQRS